MWLYISNERGCFLLDRLPQSVSKASENSELSRITFVFETTCSANCTFSFLAVRICRRVTIKARKLGTAANAHASGVFVGRVTTSG